MMKVIAVALLALALGGCNIATLSGVTPTRTVVVQPPANLYKCPLPKKPDTKKLKDSAVADYVNRLYHARQTCKASLNRIEEYSNKAAQELDPIH